MNRDIESEVLELNIKMWHSLVRKFMELPLEENKAMLGKEEGSDMSKQFEFEARLQAIIHQTGILKSEKPSILRVMEKRLMYMDYGISNIEEMVERIEQRLDRLENKDAPMKLNLEGL